MFNHQGGPGQLPTHWQPPTSQQPAAGSYQPPPPPPHVNSSLPPPPPPQEPRPDMAAHQHPQQPYRLPGPHEWTRAPPAADPYRAQPPPPNYMNHGHQPPAPRQRTAIACRYCRRRKIRCSGFEATEDGRCSNCMRFNQDCIFTPVSAQTQAFVPAHTVWRGVGQAPQLYGAYGQPIPPPNQADAYATPPRQQPGSYLPSPTGATGPYPPHSSLTSQSGVPYDDGSRDPTGRKRPYTEPHTPTLPPPNPASVSQLPLRSAGPDYTYPDPTSLTTAASPAPSSTYSVPPPPTAQPYYSTQPPRRSSPQSTSSYTYEGSHASSSPHTAAGPSPPGASPYYVAPPPNGPALQPLPPRHDGRTPPPPAPPPPTTTATSQSASRPGMRINDLVSDSGNGRSSTDSDMLNMLNRRPM